MTTTSVRSNLTKMCCVPGCTNKKGDGIRLHTIPTNPTIRKAWVHKCRLGKIITKHDRVCGRHFTASDYKGAKFFNLWTFAVPNMNLPQSSIATTKASDGKSNERLANRNMAKAAAVNNKHQQENHIQSDCEQKDESSAASGSYSAALVDKCNQVNTLGNAEVTTTDNQNIQVNTIEDFVAPITINDIIYSEKLLNAWTGIPTFKLLDAIVRCVERVCLSNDQSSDISVPLKLKDKVLLVFIKLKTNSTFICISSLFHTSESSVTRCFKSTLPLLHAALKTAVYFPTREEIRKNLPKSFKPDFFNVRAVLDCTEVPIQKPKCVNCLISTYSHYKGVNTVKFLICITPAGLISYVSAGYSGKSSDKFIFNAEQLILKFERNDAIMVDKGFAIANEALENGITLVRPSFSQSPNFQFEEYEVIENTKVSVARVHVERAIQRMKIFAILKDKVEYNIISHVSHIFFVIAAVTNLTAPIISTDKF